MLDLLYSKYMDTMQKQIHETYKSATIIITLPIMLQLP